MNLHTPYRVFLCMVACMLIAQAASAYAWLECNGHKQKWGSDNVTFYPSSSDFPSGSSWRASIEAAKNAWNNAPGTEFNFSYTYNSLSGHTSGDFTNSIVRSSSYGWSGGQLAVTITRYVPCLPPFINGGIAEVDVLFNDNETWSHDTTPNPPFADVNSVLVGLHELGHALGLQHHDAHLATMNAMYPNGGPIGHWDYVEPHGDDIWGNRAGYGTSGSPRDVYVSVYRRGAASSSTVIEAPTDIYSNQSTLFKFTVGNRGAVNESSVKVGFYLSTNKYISTGDHLLGSATLSIHQGVTKTFVVGVTIPSTISAGSYYLGWIVDPDKDIAETDEENNSVSMTTQTVLHN